MMKWPRKTVSLALLALGGCAPFLEDGVGFGLRTGDKSAALDATLAGRDATLDAVGIIGGGGDSVALWLAIGGLGLALFGLIWGPVAGALGYQHILRPRRQIAETSKGE